MKKILLFFKGIVVGIANLIPGVSGGTMAVIMGVYGLMVDFLSFKFSVIKKRWTEILFLALGMGAGILLLSWPLKFLLSNFATQCNYFFAGVVLGSIPLIYSKSKKAPVGRKQKDNNQNKKFSNFSGYICCLITFALMILIFFVSGGISKENSAIMENNFLTYLLMIPAGSLAAISMIIPGISGSFVMVVIGVYGTILSALSFDSLNIPILLFFAIGAIIGVILGARLIKFLLEKYPSQTYLGILGLIVGSIPFLTGLEGLILCALLILGAALTYLFGKKDPENQ